MKEQSQFVIFLRSLTPLSWACLGVALASFAISIYAWLPLQSHSQALLVPMHIATMAVLFGVFGIMGKHHFVALTVKPKPTPRIVLPTVYWAAVVLSLVYVFSVFFGSALCCPHGVDFGPAVNLRILASVSLFLSLAGLGFAQWAGLRLRAYRAAASG